MLKKFADNTSAMLGDEVSQNDKRMCVEGDNHQITFYRYRMQNKVRRRH